MKHDLIDFLRYSNTLMATLNSRALLRPRVATLVDVTNLAGSALWADMRTDSDLTNVSTPVPPSAATVRKRAPQVQEQEMDAFPVRQLLDPRHHLILKC